MISSIRYHRFFEVNNLTSKLIFIKFNSYKSERKNCFLHFDFILITIIFVSLSNYNFYRKKIIVDFLALSIFYYFCFHLSLQISFFSFNVFINLSSFQFFFIFILNLRTLRTLINTLRTWKSSGLLNLVSQRLMILNDPYPNEVKYHTMLIMINKLWLCVIASIMY